MNIQLEIVTPTKLILKEEIDQLTVPTTTGEITILPNHIPLLTRVQVGEMTIKKGAKTSHFAITGGFLEVKDNVISLLADYAVRAEEIEVAKARQAQEAAQNAMKQKISQRDFAQAEADLRRSLLELKVARRVRRTPPS